MLRILTSVACATCFMFGSGASAATITTSNGTLNCYQSGSTTTAAACSGFIRLAGVATAMSGTTSMSSADVWSIASVTGKGANSEKNEALLLNAVIGSDLFSESDMNKSAGNGGNMTFLFDSLYSVIKIGAGHIILRNDSGKAIDVAWSGTTKGGLSHVTQAGTIAPVPLPAAGWMLMAGLGGLAALRRRKKNA